MSDVRTVRIVSIGHKLHSYRQYLRVESNMLYRGRLITSYHYDIPIGHVADAQRKGGLTKHLAQLHLDAMWAEEETRRRKA